MRCSWRLLWWSRTVTQEDPILNYGSHLALTLWETTWEQLVQTPSRLTAEPVNRAEREWMLERARVQGYAWTITAGSEFRTLRATVPDRAGDCMDVSIDQAGHRRGQAATFSRWTFL
jgi:hypothetical protein